jgi:LPXTG-motif cell wall-anchored protein
MARILACLSVLALLAFPATALAQSAGDEQYSDPFGKVEDGSGTGGGGGGGGNATEAPAPDTSTPAAPAPAPAETSVESTGTTATDATGAQLPRTGLPVLLLAGAGALLALAGAALRRRL